MKKVVVNLLTLLFIGRLDALVVSDVNVESNNDAKVSFTAGGISDSDILSKGIIFDTEVYREIFDDKGNPQWIKDDGSYADRGTHPIDSRNLSIKFPWVAGNPDNPSTKFKIVLKRRDNGNQFVTEFAVSHPYM